MVAVTLPVPATQSMQGCRQSRIWHGHMPSQSPGAEGGRSKGKEEEGKEQKATAGSLSSSSPMFMPSVAVGWSTVWLAVKVCMTHDPWFMQLESVALHSSTAVCSIALSVACFGCQASHSKPGGALCHAAKALAVPSAYPEACALPA